MEALKEMSDNQFDLAIVDPPYFKGMGRSNFYGASRKNKVGKREYKDIECWDNGIPNEEYFEELTRVSKNQIIWGINYFSSHSKTSGRIIWDKKNDSSTFSKAEIASCSLMNSVQVFRYRWNGMIQEDMKNKEVKIHPTQKPVALYKHLLRTYAKPGEKILDTHLGSGSIAIACHDLGFDLVGYELDKHYFDAASSRVIEHQKQARLF